jgi:hypothetical protein
MARPKVLQTINLKATLEKYEIPQTTISDHFKIRAQQVNNWCVKGRISTEWQKRLKNYFKRLSIDIVYFN